ncbi:MAG TPA: hypothetical protein VGY55_02465 [Pirellulales bacterium]|jgi:hypothetical protein|nr:hypothetical protein [Pirellulales bacterium]
MKRLIFALSLNLLIVAAAHAQKPAAEKTERFAPIASHVASTGELTPTPEMWFYEQELRRWDDPQTIVRTNAEEKAAQRRARMAAMAWYGLSNSRPNVSPDPTDSPYAAHWRSNGYQPSEWVGGISHQTIILEANRGAKAY